MTSNFDTMALTLLLPILGALVVGTLGKRWGKGASALFSTGMVGLSFAVVLMNLVAYWGEVVAPAIKGAPAAFDISLWEWAQLPTNSGMTEISFGIYIDALSLTLMSVVTGVGFLIHCFSLEYMKKDPEFTRFFCLLNLFIAAMTLLVLANNFATLIIGWGGVGFASFSLIGFWREKPAAAAASKKAFVMNVIGDIGLMVAVFALFKEFGTLNYHTIFHNEVPQLASLPAADNWLSFVLAGLLVGAYAKSAQLPLHTWLPDAMEGPTPVSALIHAATMVTAGVYLLVRCHPLLELSVTFMQFVGFMGAMTALFAACCALVQNDLKRVLAYSTMSQLGYMFLAIGVGAYGAAIFHLVTHAFFKALLFLAAGIVIHTAHGEQDMRRLGGLKKAIPETCIMFGVGGAALAGVPLTAGFFSKESILHAAHHSPGMGNILFLLGALVAIMTAFYTGRAFFLTFFGPVRTDDPHLPGGPTVLSCAFLTVLAALAGFGHTYFSHLFLTLGKKESFHLEPGATTAPAIALSAFVLVALGAAYSLYSHGQTDRLGQNTTLLSFTRKGLGVDSTYEVWAGGFNIVARLATRGLDRILSGTIPDLVGRSFLSLGSTLRETQTGQTRHYMVVILVSVVALLIYSFLNLGGQAL